MITRLLLCAYLAALGWVVFAPAPDASRVTGLVGLIARFLASSGLVTFGQAEAVLEFVANVALFVPFGVLWMLAAPRLHPLAVIALGFVASVGIELVQLVLPSRVSAVSDVIANTLGTALGVVTTVAIVRAVARRSAQPRT